LESAIARGVAVAAAAAALLVQATAFAQAVRGGQYELSGSPIFTVGKTQNFAYGGSAEFDYGWGLGIQWAYNFDDHWSAGIEGAFSGADYSGTAAPGAGNANPAITFSSRAETTTVRLAATYNFITSQFTPFVSAGVGGTWINTRIQTGPSVPVCFWYPYYGQVCSGTVPTKVLAEFSYNAGVGVRYDLRPEPYFFRAVYNREWVNFGGNTGTLPFDQWRIDFGIKF